jgi:DNA-binding PadR family transcriptional regulator
MAHPDVDESLPLTPATFHILLALVGHERHGYSILREVEDATGGTLRLGATTLYRTIKHMLAAGLISESAARPDPELDDERRRYYRLTPLGERVLGAETARLAQLVHLAQAKGVSVPDLALGGGTL